MSKRKHSMYVVACETSDAYYTTIYRDAVRYFANRRREDESATLYGVTDMQDYNVIMTI